MKNPIFRIILWSLVILALAGVLMDGLERPFERAADKVFHRTQKTEVFPAVQEEASSQEAIMEENTIVYDSPSTESRKADSLSAGTEVTIQRRETINGQDWAFISAPSQGWIQTRKVQGVEASPNTATYPADKLHSIDIAWVAGSILVQTGDVEEITFFETSPEDPDYAMAWALEEGELEIDFCSERFAKSFIGINNLDPVAKDLTITVPRDWVCRELSIEAAAANLTVIGLDIREMDFDGASGVCRFEDCQVESLDMDTASGDVSFLGSLTELDFDSMSANFVGTLRNTPRQMNVDSVSGFLDVVLPGDRGFTAKLKGIQNIFSSDYLTTKQGDDTFVHGDGYCHITLDAMNGGVSIRKSAH